MRNIAAFMAYGLLLTVAMLSTSHAQGTYDLSKYTCKQLLQATSDSVDAAVWLSGYYNGLRKNTRLNLGQFRKNAEMVVAHCQRTPNATVMHTIQMISSRR